MPISDRFRSQCRLLRAAALVVFVGLFLLLAMGMVGLPWRMATDMPEGWNTRALLSVVRFLPGLGYLWALWAVQRALADLSAGRLKDFDVDRIAAQGRKLLASHSPSE